MSSEKQYTGSMIVDLFNLTHSAAKPKDVYPVLSLMGLKILLFPKRVLREAAKSAATRWKEYEPIA